MHQARELATHAVALDDSVASAHSTLGIVYSHRDFNWDAAEREFRRGIELNPSDANAHLFYSNSFLSPHGRHAQALAEMQTAIDLDPLSAPINSFLGRTYVWAGRYTDALAHLQSMVQRFPRFALNHQRLADAYRYLGRYDAAIAEESLTARLLDGDERNISRRENALRAALAERGARGYWFELLKWASQEPHLPESFGGTFGAAIVHAELGEKDEALDKLEVAYEKRMFELTELGIEPAFASLHAEPRFLALIRRVGLAP